ncbi:MAG: hypothetical protein JW986_06445 [Methanotrichaceae archaeon]|nr:hypothetical protein [Methanotrichaceae archaeon]
MSETISIELGEWQEKRESGATLPDDPHIEVIIDELRRSHQIDINPTRSGIRVKAFSYVGRIGLGRIQITILPKIPIDRLLNLLHYAYGFGDLKLFDRVGWEEGDPLFQDLLVNQLVRETKKILWRGMHRRYTRTCEDLRSPRGRIDVQRLARRYGRADAALPCIYHPRLEDCLLNQVVLAGLDYASRITEAPGLRADCRQLASRMKESVSVTRLDLVVIGNLRQEMNRLTRAYEPAINIIEMLLGSAGISMNDDLPSGYFPGLLFDMNILFQRILYKFISDNLDGYFVYHEHCIHHLIEYMPKFNPKGRRAGIPRPDFTIYEGSRQIALLDAKYRDLWENPLEREMLYQLIIYALSDNNLRKATILYPAVDPRAIEQRIRIDVNDSSSHDEMPQVILRPVNLEKIDDLITSGSKEAMNKYAAELVFGEL